jgi:hypothetical protein
MAVAVLLGALIAGAQNARIVLRWKDVPGASAYEVQIARDAAFVEVVLQTRTTTAGYRWEQLPTTTHWWRVRSFDGEGRASEWSPPRSLAVDSAIPTPLKPLDASSIPCGAAVTFELDASPLVKEYLIELSASAEFSGLRTLRSATPGLEVPGLTAGTWYWRTRAVDIKGRTTDTGPLRSFAVKVAPPRLKPVGDVALGVPQVQLSWSEAGCAESYLVEATIDGKTKVAIPSPGTTLAFKAGAAGEYRWRVASVDERKTAGEFSAESVFRVRLPTPVLKAEAGDLRRDLSWSVVPTATSYKVELLRDGERGGEPVASASVSGTTWRTPELTPGVYRWRVTARDALNHASAPSEARSFTRAAGLPLAMPTLVNPTSDVVVEPMSEVRVSWSASPEATGYELEFDGQLSKGPATSFTTPALTIGSHAFRLRATGPGYRFSDWVGPIELYAGVPPVARAEVTRVEQVLHVTLFDAKGRLVSGATPRFKVRDGGLEASVRAGDGWDVPWLPPASGEDVLTIEERDFTDARPIELGFDPYVSVAVRAGGIFNAGAIASPSVGLGVTVRLPFFRRRPGIELRVGGLRAASATEVAGGRVEGEAWMLPITLLLAWHHNVGSFQLKGGAGPVVQPLWLTVGPAASFQVLPGVEAVLSLSRRIGPGRLEGEVSFLYGRLESPLARLNAGGLAVRVGYAFDFL